MEHAHPVQCLVFDPEHESPNLSGCLAALGYRVSTATDAEAAQRAVISTPCELAFVAVRAREPASIELISTLLSQATNLEVIALVRASDLEAALEAGRRGACCCIANPASFADVDQALERLARLRPRGASPDASTASPRMRSALNTALKAASVDTPLLFSGEAGTGREALARLVHERSARQGKPFVTVRSAHTTQSDLARHAREAEGGTLLLLEVSTLSPELQGWLDRALTSGEIGDVRVMATTSQDLGEALSADLRRRLGVVTVELPPLRQRPEDVIALAEATLARAAGRTGRSAPDLGPSARVALLGYDWPGNMPELEGEIERALVMTPGNVIECAALSEKLRPTARAAPYVGGDFTIQEIERAHIERVLARSRTFDGAAQLLGIDDSTLWRKRKRYANGAARTNGTHQPPS